MEKYQYLGPWCGTFITPKSLLLIMPWSFIDCNATPSRGNGADAGDLHNWCTRTELIQLSARSDFKALLVIQ